MKYQPKENFIFNNSIIKIESRLLDLSSGLKLFDEQETHQLCNTKTYIQ